MLCYGSYQPNLDENRGSAAWGIHFKDTYKYAWGYLPTISQVVNAYI